MDIAAAQNLVEIVQAMARDRADQTAYVFLTDGEDQEERISFSELDLRARAFAACLQESAVPGDRALLMYPSGLEFICAFLGCLYAGVVAVPSVVPHLRRASSRLSLILADSQPRFACAPADVVEKTRSLVNDYPQFAQLRWLAHEQVRQDAAAAWRPVKIERDHLALLQYTSGSTSAPKGTMITHSNLLYNIIDMLVGSAFDETSTIVMWLPIFHDMGLVYGLLAPLSAGRPSIFMSPVAFLERPFRWLRAVSRYDGTHAVAPNFAFDLCAQKITSEEISQLDLSSLRVAGNAAEPVRLETLRRFEAAFSSCGFNPNTFCPGYGLAESTAKVTNKVLQGSSIPPISVCALDADALERNELVFLPLDAPQGYKSVGCGWSSIGADIRIVDPKSSVECKKKEVGEIWISSPSVAQGYWGHPAETKAAFRAYLQDTGAGPFLRTGDMGFVHEGQLHIVGRIKDMIIVQGRNLYPQDIELTAEQSHPAFNPTCAAAFSVDDGRSERLVVVQEVKREFRRSPDFEKMANALRMAVARNHGLRVAAVVLIAPSSIHKTTSGKIQRRANMDAFLRGELSVLYQWRAPGSFGAATAD